MIHNFKQLFLVIILVSLLTTTVFNPVVSIDKDDHESLFEVVTINNSKSSSQPMDFQVHSRIRINNDTDFNASNGVSNGTGTLSNPYIIDNLEINGSGHGACIYIGNTTKHFIIRNCSLHNATGNQSGEFYRDSGIYLYNLSNATVYNNTIYKNNGSGIYAHYSNHNLIQENDIYQNQFAGIYFESCELIKIIENNISWNNEENVTSYGGIYLSNSDFNWLDWNYVNNNPQFGLVLGSSNDNKVLNNQIVFNCGGNAGIYLDNAHYNTCGFNNVSNNTGEGFEIYNSDNCKFYNNTICGNGEEGIYYTGSSGNNWLNNTINFNYNLGLQLTGGDFNTFTNNNFSSNKGLGIDLYRTHDNDFTDNLISNNDNFGILIMGSITQGSNSNSFINNTVSNNFDHGIFIQKGSENAIIRNQIVNNSNYGIRADTGSSNCTIHHNNFYFNNGGDIQAWDSSSTINFWNDTKNRGNYWKDYLNRYPNATNNGYFWNIPYDINGSAGGKDNYPLAYPIEYVIPEISDDSELIGFTGNQFTFSCIVIDDSNVSQVFTKYWYGQDDLISNNDSLIYNFTTGNWELNITILWNTTEDLNYELSAVDPNENWAETVSSTVPITDDDPPNANAGDDVEILIGNNVIFNGTGSFDNIGIINYSWYFEFDDQDIFLYGDNPEYKFTIADDYLITLLVTDQNNFNDTDSIWVNVSDIKGPNLIELIYAPIINISDDIIITVKVSDVSGIGLVKLDYNLLGSQYNITMNKQNELWQKIIPGQVFTTVLSFHISMSDLWGNWNKTEIHFIEIQDNVLPQISEIIYEPSIEIGRNTTITANVFDTSGISNVKLNYTNISGHFHNVTMNNTIGIEYISELPVQNLVGKISFYIWALDINNNWNKTSTYELEIKLNMSTIKKPEIILLDVPTEIYIDSDIHISVEIIDLLQIKAVYLNYTDIKNEIENVTMTTEENNLYSFTIPSQHDIGTLSFHISVLNELDIWNNTSVKNIKIIKKVFKDIIPPEVNLTLPADNSTVVRIDTNVVIIFTERMNTTQFKLNIDILPLVDFDLSWDVNHIELTLVFKTVLQYGTTYVITIGTSAKDLAGNGLVSPHILLFSTQPIVTDSDKDGMLDQWEKDHDLDPNNPNDAQLDNDSDGLTNLQEFLNLTDPKNSDSDSDGLNDGSEIETHNTNPNNPDSDGDNYNDGKEVESGSDPNNIDSIPSEKKEDDDYIQEIILIIIVIFVVILILVFLLIRNSSKLKEKQETEELEDDEELEEISDEEDKEDLENGLTTEEVEDDEIIAVEDELEEVLGEFETGDENPEGLIVDDSELIEE